MILLVEAHRLKFGIPLAGLTIVVGLISFFLINKEEKQSGQDSGLNIIAIGECLKIPMIWFWIVTPSFMNLIAIILSRFILPDYLSHVMTRSSAVLSYDQLVTLVLQVVVLALGVEIAWRAFFQKRVKAFMPIMPAILISSVFFSLGHISKGTTVVVLYDLFFIFVNSFMDGIIFDKPTMLG